MEKMILHTTHSKYANTDVYGVTHRYRFTVYFGETTHTGYHRDISGEVQIKAYGLIITHVTEFQGQETAHDIDMGYLSTKSNEVNYLAYELARRQLPTLDAIKGFILVESTPWKSGFDRLADKQLRKQLGLFAKGPRPTIKPVDPPLHVWKQQQKNRDEGVDM